MIIAFIVWLYTIGFFILTLQNRASMKWSTFDLVLLFGNIGLGLLAFLFFILKFEQAIRKKFKGVIASLLSIISFFGFLVFGFILSLGPLVLLNKNLPNSQVEVQNNRILSSGLKIGSTGEEVKLLQILLSEDRAVYPSRLVSGYYGEMTATGVSKFQEKQKLTITGEVNNATADMFNELFGNNTKEFYLSKVPSKLVTYNSTNTTVTNNSGGENYIMKPVPDKQGFFKMENVPDEKMATVEELNAAMNSYRQAHGLNGLNNNSELCRFAAQRAQEISTDFTHDGFHNHTQNGDFRGAGYSFMNENIWRGYFSATHIIEFGWDRSEGHRHTQLDNWSGGCAGVYGANVAFLFGR